MNLTSICPALNFPCTLSSMIISYDRNHHLVAVMQLILWNTSSLKILHYGHLIELTITGYNRIDKIQENISYGWENAFFFYKQAPTYLSSITQIRSLKYYLTTKKLTWNIHKNAHGHESLHSFRKSMNYYLYLLMDNCSLLCK